MDKKRLFRIMAKASDEEIRVLAEEIMDRHEITVIKEPVKTLAMIKMREPVKQSLFYIGEVIVCEAVVMVDQGRGMAVTMGDHLTKVYHMAVIDAACNSGIFTGEERLLAMEKRQIEREEKENAMHLNTKVDFNSMNPEAV